MTQPASNLCIPEAAFDREYVARGGFVEYVKLAWQHVEPAPLIWGWHLDELAIHLEAVARLKFRKLLINLPPGFSKSTIVSVLWPSWCWIIKPDYKFICASYEASLAQRDAKRMRDLIDSQWWQDRWGEGWEKDAEDVVTIPFGNERAVRVFRNDHGGFRYSTGAGAGFTGWHGNVHIVDDPHAAHQLRGSEASIKKHTEKIYDWWTKTMISRAVNPRELSRVIVMQRLHENDLSGQMLRDGGYEHLCLPMRYEAERKYKRINIPCKTRVGGDHRVIEGELLCPERIDEEARIEQAIGLGATAEAAQHQQHPSAATGNIIKRAWLGKFWDVLPADPRATWMQTWDMAFKETADSDWVVGQVWIRLGAQFFLVDQVRERMDLVGTCAAVRTLTTKWPRAFRKIIEDKANGPAVVSVLQKTVPGLVLVNPEGGKEARASAISPLFEAGNVILPNPENHPWVHDYIEELATFPKGANDDQVDATSQVLLQMYVRTSRLKEAMAQATIDGLIK